MGVESATSSSKSKEITTDDADAASDVCKPVPAPSIQVSVTADAGTNNNVNVEAASASMKEEDEEDEMAESSESTEEESLQINNPENEDEKETDTDTDEMAIVSETMANASLANSGGCASEQRPRGAVAEARPKEDPDTSESTQKPKQAARKKKRTPPLVQPGQSSGRWTHAEHEAFLEGLKVFGREWKKVAVRIPTRTSAQVRSHAQKYFSKLARDEQVMNQENQAYEAAASAAAAASSGSAAVSASEAHPEPSTQSYPPSIQRSVDRILADPEQAQRDVEDTLRALRERYRLLQQRLQEAPPSREGTPSNMVEDEEEEEEEEKEHNNEQQQQEDQDQQQLEGNSDQQQQQQRPEDEPRRGKLTRREGDEDCSMSSASASALSSLGNEELIALSVLGGTLPNGHARATTTISASASDPNRQPAMDRNGSNSSLESDAAAENGHAAIASSDGGTNTPKRKREEK